MPFSTFLGDKIIDHMLRGEAYTAASRVYASLHHSDPGLTGANEISGSGYGRQVIWLNASSAKATTSASVLSFTSMPSGSVAWAGIWNNDTSGSFFMSGSLSASKNVNQGDTFQFPVSDFDVILT